jgi:hypothetical protein
MTVKYAALIAAATTAPLWWHVLASEEDVYVALLWSVGVFTAAWVATGILAGLVEFMKPNETPETEPDPEDRWRTPPANDR